MSGEGWKKCYIGELCESVSITHKSKKGQLIFLNTGDIERGKFLHRAYSDVSQMPGQAKKSIQKGDILFSEIRPANGRYAFVDFDAADYIVSTKLMVIRCNERIIPSYFYLFLTSKQTTDWLQHLAESRSGTFPQITFDQVADLEISLPDLTTQSRIASILSALDDKIELNRQTNATLEAIAHAIFKEWFVDFRYPGATGEMQDSELSPIPKGWRVGKLGEFGEIICGKTPSKAIPQYFGGDIPFVKIPDMHGSVFITHTFDTLTDNGALSQRKKFVPPYSVIVSCIATVGLVALTSQQCQTNQQINAIIQNNKNAPFYLYFVAKNLGDTLKDLGSGGSATLNVNTKSFADIECLAPTEKTVRNFNELIKPLFSKILELEHESSALVDIRDALLPKLMSGNIEV